MYLALGFLPQLSVRGAVYFYLFEIVLASMIIYRMPSIKKKLYIYSFFILISIYRQISFFNEYHDEYIPYKTCLDKYI